MSEPVVHKPVLYNEIIHALKPGSPGRYVDGTLGAGGHARGILEASHPDGQLLGMDVDPDALEVARRNLQPFGGRAVLVQASYTNLSAELDALGWKSVDGILLDLGLSSMQLGSADRGFSFQIDAPLDMRFNPLASLTADDLVNRLSEQELADIIYKYGEERRSRQVAKAIVRARPIHTTQKLAEVVASATRSGSPGIHPATRTFQSLRIAVNDELEAIEVVLPQTISHLTPGGRLAVLSFHSLEDRIIKHFFRQESRDCICPPRQPICTCGHRASIEEVTRRPIRPSETEIQSNPRSRSARLRVAEKLEPR
jgi:16S rRNA (cytosine1402-N4)-methyltransferase